jgi:hypothetical protein
VYDQIGQLQTVGLVTGIRRDNSRCNSEYFPAIIADVETLRRESSNDTKPIIDLTLAITFALAAQCAEGENNKQVYDQYTKSAQDILKSLGWRDYSPKTIRKVADAEIAHWNPQIQAGKKHE